MLRLNRLTGKPWPSNPFIGAANGKKRYVYTYGHRNVQGLAQRRDGTLWSAEHGPDRDDEVNRLVAGGDYGWNPVPGYNESVPMTDQSLPGDQIDARLELWVPDGRHLRRGLGVRRQVGQPATARWLSPRSRPAGSSSCASMPTAASCAPGPRCRCGSTAGCAHSP